jgi:beta-glucosidase
MVRSTIYFRAAGAIALVPGALAAACSHLPERTSASSDGFLIGGGTCVDGGYCLRAFAASSDAAVAAKSACGDQAYGDPWTTPGYQEDPAVAAKVSETIASMTLPELAQQMRGTDPGNGSNFGDIFRTPDNPTPAQTPLGKGIRGFKFRDGPRGVCLAAQLPSGQKGYSTAFPAPEARAASFDIPLEERIGAEIADEVLASGNTMLLAPVVNILRHPGWGRAQETYGEDSYVLGRFGAAFTTGAQQLLPVCVKHYAANNVEDGRAGNDAEMDEQTLREVYTRHFGVVIRDAGVACVMSSYNLVNGQKASLNDHLFTDILREDFQFPGFVLSDWWAMPPGTNVTTTDTHEVYAIEGIRAGLDMELPWAYNYEQLEAVTGPQAPLAPRDLAISATRILRQKFRFHVADLEDPVLGLQRSTTTIDGTGSIAGNDAHIADAEQAALEGMVLLTNDGTLPIRPGSVQHIAVIGGRVPFEVPGTVPPRGTVDFARDVRLGDLGSSRVFSDPARSTGPYDGIRNNAPPGITVVAGNSDADVPPNTDLIVAVVGLTPEDEGEEYTGAGDRTSFDLDGKPNERDTSGALIQNPLMTRLLALGKPVVVVVEAGANVAMPWLTQVRAIVMAWYPGQQGGDALGRLLFGTANFSGKLPFTWPALWSDEPPFHPGTLSDDYYVGYSWFDHYGITPLYAFGHGLSYTTYAYANLDVPCTSVSPGAVVPVTVDITNTGSMAGDETAFLFVAFPGSPVRRPQKLLKSFARVSLMPGETQRVTLPIRVDDLQYWDTTSNGWKPPTGPVQVMVGPSSDALPLTDVFTVQ